MKKLSSLYLLILFGMAATLFFACGDDEAPDTPKTIGEILKTDPQFSEFKNYVLNGGEFGDSLLNGEGPYTIFVPSNSAFENVNLINEGYNENDWQRYHAIEGSYKLNDLPDGQTYASALSIFAPGDNHNAILINKTGNSLKVNNIANATTVDIIASNGVIHVIDKILKPITLTEFVEANTELESLQKAMSDTDNGSLYNKFDPQNGWNSMMFAPTNSAFEAAANEINVLTDEQMLKLLNYHIVFGYHSYATLTEGISLTTDQGETLTVNRSGDNVTLTDAHGNSANIVVKQAIYTPTGVLYLIDKVLFPDNL